MADAKHTRGPWLLRGTIITPADTDQVEIAEILTDEDETAFDDQGNLIGSSLGDGLLLAAAPELLEALEEVLHEWVRDLTDAGEEDIEDKAYVKFARRVIAKATGSTS